MSGGAAGPWYIGDDYAFYQTAHDPTTGGAIDADSPPTFRVYEKTTGTPILTETMALHDAANTVGVYSASFELLATTGFEVGKSYGVLKLVTVGGVLDTQIDAFKVLATPAGSDPWATDISSGYTGTQAGKVLNDLTAAVAAVLSAASAAASAAVSAAAGIVTLLARLPGVITLTGGKVTPIDSEDGVEFARYQRAMMASRLGKTNVNLGGLEVEFLDQNNTKAVTNTYNGTDGKRTGSSLHAP